MTLRLIFLVMASFLTLVDARIVSPPPTRPEPWPVVVARLRALSNLPSRGADAPAPGNKPVSDDRPTNTESQQDETEALQMTSADHESADLVGSIAAGACATCM